MSTINLNEQVNSSDNTFILDYIRSTCAEGLSRKYAEQLNSYLVELVLNLVFDKQFLESFNKAIRIANPTNYLISLVDDRATYYYDRSTKLERYPRISNSDKEKLSKLGIKVNNSYGWQGNSTIEIDIKSLSPEHLDTIKYLKFKIEESGDSQKETVEKFKKLSSNGILTYKKIYLTNKPLFDALVAHKESMYNNVDMKKLSPEEKINLVRFKLGD